MVHQSLVRHLQKEVKMAHITRIPCPALLCKNVKHTHRNNGTFVAVDKDGGVYTACTTCKITEASEGVVKGTLEERYQWLAVDATMLQGT